MWMRLIMTPMVAVGLLAGSADDLAPQLQPKTRAAFDRYVTVTEARIATELDGRQPFLWINRLPAAAKADAMSRLERGEVVHERLETRDNGKSIEADDGMIHHWIGSVLLPKVSLAKARSVVERYDQYPRVLKPMVQNSRVVSRTGDNFLVQMRTSMTKAMVTVVIDADYDVSYRSLGPSRLYTRSVAGNIFEVKSAGEPGETRIQGDKSGGFLWRLNTYCSFEEIPAGTVEQCESISLTRGIPIYAFFVKPFVTSIPRDTLAFTLGRVREEAMHAR